MRLHRTARTGIRILSIVLTLLLTAQTVSSANYYQLPARALVTVAKPDVVLQSGTAGTNTIYVNSTSASTSVSTYTTYNPSSYSLVTGTFVSGTVPGSVQTADTNYFIVNSATIGATTTTAYNPSTHVLVGGTSVSSGTVSNLAADDSSYFSFKSYPTQFSSTNLSIALGAYASTSGSGTNFPKARFWGGSSWGSESEQSTAGSPIRWVRAVYSPLGARFNETIVVTLSNDGFLDAYVYDGSTWTVTNNIGDVGTTVNAYRAFDIAYETSSGEALLVYSLPGGNHRVGYKTWNGSTWSSESTFNLEASTAGDVRWVEMASKSGSSSNEILIATLSDSRRIHGVVWTGSALGNTRFILTTHAAQPGFGAVDAAYEMTSGYGTVAAGQGSGADSIQWSGSAWDASVTSATSSGRTNWLSLKADPASGSDKLFLVTITNAGELMTAEWSGTAWTQHTTHDTGADTNAGRCADFAWEPSGSKGLLVWGTTAGQIAYKTFTYSNSFGTQQNPTMGTNTHPWVQLETNPRNPSGDILILGMVHETTALDTGAVKWDGTTFTVIGASTFTGNAGTSTYETFDLAFRRFGNPTEYTSEVEFTGTSNTGTWTQLVWSLDSAWDTASVTVTVQLYNYTSASYPASGNGYDTYTSSGTANTDEARTQTITSGSQTFRDGSGNWKLKVKGVKTTAAQFIFKADWAEFKPTYYSEYAAEIDFIITGVSTTTPTRLNFTVVSQYDAGSVAVTVRAFNYTGSAFVTSGQGYATYTSVATPADETQVLTITTNPNFYTSAGEAKIRIKGLKTTLTQFQQKTNLLVLHHFTDNTFDHVLKVVNQVGSSWNIRLSKTSESNIARATNYTIYFHDGSTSRQIYINNGAYVDTTGPWFTLAASATDYIAIRAISSNVGTTVIDVNLEIRSPTSAPTVQYIIRFRIS